MALGWVDDKGIFSLVRKAPAFAEYKLPLARIDTNAASEVSKYIRKQLYGVEKFSVAMIFGGAKKVWLGTPLAPLLRAAGGNPELAAILLGIFVYTHIVTHDRRTWVGIKTTMKGRDLATNFYFQRRTASARFVRSSPAG